MLVRNWMHPDPITIRGDTLVSEAKRLMSDNNLHALPVVDDDRLRGLVTRANLLRMGQFVLRTQNPDEFNFFVARLKVRDVMVRQPMCVAASDTMEHCLRLGQELGIAQFPVMEGDRVVGVISANEIFQLAAHCIGAWGPRNGVTLAAIRLGPGVLARICEAVGTAGAAVQGIYPIGRHDSGPAQTYPVRPVIVRFQGGDFGAVVRALEAAGFAIIEAVDTHREEIEP
ncbi:MAG: CBS domain-containing protein [Burkholderiales bacterium]|nr:CBS domain-containing protein [Burkholderiales bacterium]OJX03774.1 MAG: protein stimulating phenylphosphate synthetase activity [Burkholderiales bacterium 70-64]